MSYVTEVLFSDWPIMPQSKITDYQLFQVIIGPIPIPIIKTSPMTSLILHANLV